jgi:hypothetical protein
VEYRIFGGLVPVIILLVAALAVVGLASVVFWLRRAASCGRIIEAPASDPDRVFAGDIMCRFVMTSGSLCRLEFHDWGIRIRGIAIAKWMVPTWEARYPELARTELITSRSRVAVWLRLRGESGGCGFLSARSSQDVLRELEKHDVQVSRAPAEFRRVAELYPRQ